MKTFLTIVYILVATWVGIVFGFADLGADQSFIVRALIQIIYFGLVGLAFGYFAPTRKRLSIIIGAIPTVLGLLVAIDNIGSPLADSLFQNIFFALLPLLTIGGAYLGANLKMKKTGAAEPAMPEAPSAPTAPAPAATPQKVSQTPPTPVPAVDQSVPQQSVAPESPSTPQK